MSPAYGSLIPAPQIRFRSDRSHRHTAFVLAQAHTDPWSCVVTVEADSAARTAIEIAWSGYTDRIVVSHDSAPVPAFGGQFDGAVLWLRSRGSEPGFLRCIDTRSVRLPQLRVDIEAGRRREWFGVQTAPSGFSTSGDADQASIRWSDASAAGR